MELIHKEAPVIGRSESTLDILLSVMILIEDFIELGVHLLKLNKQGILLIGFSLHGGMWVIECTFLLFQHTGGETYRDFNIFVGHG